MWDNVKELFTSKKFKVALFSIVALVFSVLAEQITVSQALDAAWPIILAYLGAQGLSDGFGKGKVEEEAKHVELFE
jgi:hypothetical protein